MKNFDRFTIGSLSGDELAKELCQRLEVKPDVTARQVRATIEKWDWYSSYTYLSPFGWWQAEIGTDHGPPEDDDLVARWKPLSELADDIAVAWRVVEEMKDRGWLFHILTMTDGFVVNARRYKFVDFSRNWKDAMFTNDFVQQPGDTAPEAICRAALDALVTQ